MNTFAKVIFVSVVIALPALSGNAYSHAKTDSKGGMMMDQQQTMNMRGRMQENQALMEQIRTEHDADERNKMMQQHMEAMQEQMHMMDKMMGGDDKGDMSSEAMPESMQVMNMRMDMMQMMMKQMMEHQDQDEDLDQHHDD